MWDNGDLVTHEVMGGLKNVYAIGAGKNLTRYFVLLRFSEFLKMYLVLIIEILLAKLVFNSF